MKGQRRTGLALGLCLALCVGGIWAGGPARAEETGGDAVRIGLIGTLFRDLPEPMVQASMGPFRALMESQTGIRGTLVRSANAFTLGKLLCSDKVQLGVFHGFEFAWAKQKYPDLRPLVIAINQDRILYAYLLVPKNSPAHSLADLKGKSLAIPHRTREHCRLFLERACQKEGKPLTEFFGKINSPACVEDALDDTVDGANDAVLVDGVSLECFKRRKPGRFARLRVLMKSAAFPAAVVAYHEGGIDEATLNQFQRGMLNANKTAFGRQLLTLWQMTGFEKVPENFAAALETTAKLYPPPTPDKGLKAVIHKD